MRILGQHYSNIEPQQLFGIQAKVYPDGSKADITLHATTGRVDFTVAFENMAAVQAEIRSASLLMLYRQSMAPDGGARAIEDLLATALRPMHTDVSIDTMTGDRVFVMHFADRMPIVIRRTPQQVLETLADLATEAQRASN